MLVWFATVCSFATRGLIRLGPTDSERLQTSMPELEFEPPDYGTKGQRPTIRPSPSDI